MIMIAEISVERGVAAEAGGAAPVQACGRDAQAVTGAVVVTVVRLIVILRVAHAMIMMCFKFKFLPGRDSDVFNF
eukprot:1789521-Rhodomonas_salina.1